MGNSLCQSCNTGDCEAMYKHSSNLDLQGEYSTQAVQEGTVMISARADLPRLALGRKEELADVERGLVGVTHMANVATLVKPNAPPHGEKPSQGQSGAYVPVDKPAMPKSCVAKQEVERLEEGVRCLENCVPVNKPAMQESCAAKQEKVEDLEEGLPCLEVVFDVKGKEKHVKIFKRPLGAEFSKKPYGPAKVSKVRSDSYASQLGIEFGWILKSIGGENVGHMTFQQVQETLKGGLTGLPEDRRR